jgi:phosphomevalonate kinase
VDGEAVKLGLGSSAALTVALASALSDWSSVGDRPQPSLEWLQRLLEMHRGFQGGRGSGVDLAASLLGGILEYRLAQDGSVMTAESARLPEELGVVAVWTGRAADTGEILERLSRRLERGDAAIRRALTRLGEISEAAVLAARADDGRSLLACVDRSGTAMDELGRAAGIDIVSARHRELTRLAREAGISYKPSGAGVGDMGVGLALDEIALNEFKAAVTDLGLRLFPVTLASDGLR